MSDSSEEKNRDRIAVFFDANIPYVRKLKNLLQSSFPGSKVIFFPPEFRNLKVNDGKVLQRAVEELWRFPQHKKILLTRDTDFDSDSGIRLFTIQELEESVLLIMWNPPNQKIIKVGEKKFFAPLLAVLELLCTYRIEIVGTIFIDYEK